MTARASLASCCSFHSLTTKLKFPDLGYDLRCPSDKVLLTSYSWADSWLPSFFYRKRSCRHMHSWDISLQTARVTYRLQERVQKRLCLICSTLETGKAVIVHEQSELGIYKVNHYTVYGKIPNGLQSPWEISHVEMLHLQTRVDWDRATIFKKNECRKKGEQSWATKLSNICYTWKCSWRKLNEEKVSDPIPKIVEVFFNVLNEDILWL